LALRDLWEQKDEWTRSFDAEAKAWPIGNEAVAVLQRDGQFVILDAADGQPTVELHLRDEPNLKEIALQRSADRDILIVNRKANDGNMQFLPPGPTGIGMLNGWVYAFDRRTGKLVWERQVERRSLSMNQGVDVPVLVFASTGSQFGNNQQVGLLCLDKRDGRVLLDERFANQSLTMELVAAPDRDEVAIRLNRGGARLLFSDQPWGAKE